MKRWEIDIQGGEIVVRATIILRAASYEAAEAKAVEMVKAIDHTAYVNTIYEDE